MIRIITHAPALRSHNRIGTHDITVGLEVVEWHLHALVAIVTVIRHNSSCTYVQTGRLCSIELNYNK